MSHAAQRAPSSADGRVFNLTEKRNQPRPGAGGAGAIGLDAFSRQSDGTHASRGALGSPRHATKLMRSLGLTAELNAHGRSFHHSDRASPHTSTKTEVRTWLDTLIGKVEGNAVKEQRAADRDREREVKRLDREVKGVLDKVLRRVEKMYEKSHERDGEIYTDSRRPGMSRGTFKVRATPCREWFDLKSHTLRRDESVEDEVRRTLNSLKAARRPGLAVVPAAPGHAHGDPQPVGPAELHLPLSDRATDPWNRDLVLRIRLDRSRKRASIIGRAA